MRGIRPRGGDPLRSFLSAAIVLSLLPHVTAAVSLEDLEGGPADIAPSAYLWRRDRPAGGNPPESWIGLIQVARLAPEKPVDPRDPAIARILCGLLWEEVRPVRRVELSWPAGASRPAPGDIVLRFLDGADGNAHTWWNPCGVREAREPEVSADGSTWTYPIPADTWCVVVAAAEGKDAGALSVPEVRALVPDRWKRMELEIEWGFDAATSALPFGGRLEAYDGKIGEVRPLPGDRGTAVTGPASWNSPGGGGARRGLRAEVLYTGTSRWRRAWPYHAPHDEVARTILTVRTESGTFSFRVSDLEPGPILAPEYGFFVRAVALGAVPPEAGEALPRESPVVLEEKMEAIPGVPKVRGWARNVIPWFGVNPEGSPGKAGNLTIPGRCAALHPGPDLDAAVEWRSPISGRVVIEGRVAMGDSAGGNGIDWSVVAEGRGGRRLLAGGAIPAGGAAALPGGGPAAALAAVPVEPGDVLSLVIGAKGGNHICDTTVIDLRIAEVGGGGRKWDLAGDVAGDIHSGNPHADAAGNRDAWRLVCRPPAPPPPAPSEPPFPLASAAPTAREFAAELRARGLATVRRRTREHPEQTWEGAVGALHDLASLPPIPAPAFEPPMRVEVPCPRLTAQWKLGASHILERSRKGEDGRWRFNDHPFGILASETYMILRALDLQGMHREAADGLDQWLRLPVEPRVVPGGSGHHEWAIPDRPLGHFSDGRGCLTHAEGIPGWGGHMDGVHAMGPGAIGFVLAEHFLLTGDLGWLRSSAPRMKANAEWILRQRRLLERNIPGGERLWGKGLQPAHVVTPDSFRMHMQFYESEAYYWLAVRKMADLLARIDPAGGAALEAEAEAYRKDIVAAVVRSIELSPVVAVRDGTYRSFIPFAPHVRGFATGAWGWRRCQGHVGAIYWDTVQSADPLISPAGLLSPLDPRVQGHLDVLEDRLLLENTKIRERLPDFDAARDWFSRGSWQYQCGLERHANIHLAADDPANFLRSMLNQYAVDIMPGAYTFREHTTGGPPDKIYEESCFLERFRDMLVHDAPGGGLWLARATPRAWLEDGKRIAVSAAPSHLGPVSFEIRSGAGGGRIAATVEMPTRPGAVVLRLRHPEALPIRSVTVDGRPWTGFDREAETVRLGAGAGKVSIEARY